MSATAVLGLPALGRPVTVSRRASAKAARPAVARASVRVTADLKSAAVKAVAPLTTLVAGPAFAAQELGQVAGEVNILGVIAVALFILIPVSFLLILYIKSTAEQNQSGGFSQEYYDESYKRGDKKAK